jgi:hypothetical protein
MQDLLVLTEWKPGRAFTDGTVLLMDEIRVPLSLTARSPISSIGMLLSGKSHRDWTNMSDIHSVS